MAAAGHDEAAIAAALDRSWVWRNIFVAASDAAAERTSVPYYEAMTRSRSALRQRIQAETGEHIAVPANELPEARAQGAQGLLYGSPATVTAALAEVKALGVGGVLASFRLGPMPHAVAAESLGLFMREVAPRLRAR